MVAKEELIKIQILHQQGMSLRRIAKEFGISRNTGKRYLSGKLNAPQYSKRANTESKLNPYQPFRHSRITQAAPVRLSGEVLHREIKDLSYTGSISLLRQYLYGCRGMKQPEQVIRFETEPGKQMQVDWGQMRGGKHPIHGFIAVLSYRCIFSAMFVMFTDNMGYETLELCHRAAFEYFQGIPKDVWYDNMKTVVIER